MNGESMATPDDDPLGPVVESFLDELRRGRRPAMTELIARHPELAARIRELIPALVELEQLGASSGSLTPPRGAARSRANPETRARLPNGSATTSFAAG